VHPFPDGLSDQICVVEFDRFIVRADDKLTAFTELEWVIRRRPAVGCIAWLDVVEFTQHILQLG
jgi:hypothetical protein